MKYTFYRGQIVFFTIAILKLVFLSIVSDKAIWQCDISNAQASLKLTSDFPRLKQAPLVNSSQCHSASCREREREGEKQRKAPNKPSRRSKHQKHLAACHHEPLWRPLREPKQNNAWLSTVAAFPPFWSQFDVWWLDVWDSPAINKEICHRGHENTVTNVTENHR